MTDDKLHSIVMVSFAFSIVMTTAYIIPNDNILINTFHLGIILGSQQDTLSEAVHTSVKYICCSTTITMCHDNMDKNIVRHSESSWSSAKSYNIQAKYNQKIPRTISCNIHIVTRFRKANNLELLPAAHCTRQMICGIVEINHRPGGTHQNAEIIA